MPKKRTLRGLPLITKGAERRIESLLRSGRLDGLVEAIGPVRARKLIEKEAMWTAIWHGRDSVSEANVDETARLILRALPKIPGGPLRDYVDT